MDGKGRGNENDLAFRDEDVGATSRQSRATYSWETVGKRISLVGLHPLATGEPNKTVDGALQAHKQS